MGLRGNRGRKRRGIVVRRNKAGEVKNRLYTVGKIFRIKVEIVLMGRDALE